MEQITIVLNDMEDVKREIDNCQRKAVKSVVELGYILRKADDAELFREAGYSSIFKFAEAEYGWNQSQTSRFMDINREFSKDGYSTELQERYTGYGQAKLSEMLTLPDNIREELSPDMKREDIREVKRQTKQAAEQEAESNFAATVSFESTDNNFLTDSIKTLLGQKEFVDKFRNLYPHFTRMMSTGTVDTEAVAMAVSGTGFGFTRAGAYMYFFKDTELRITKGMQKKTYSYEEFIKSAAAIRNPSGLSAEEWYEKVFGITLPVEQKKEPPKPQKKEPPKPKPKKPVVERKNVDSEQPEEPIECEGQTEIGEFAEKEEIGSSKTEGNNENSISDKDFEEPVAPAQEKQLCSFCETGGYITSDDGATTLTILKLLDDKGNVKVEMRDVSGKVRFNRCPMCGRCFE